MKKTEDGYRYVRQYGSDYSRDPRKSPSGPAWALWERKGGRMRRVGTARTPGEVDAFLGMAERKAPEPCSCEESMQLRKELAALYVERNRLETRLAFIEGQHKLLVRHVADEAIKEMRTGAFGAPTIAIAPRLEGYADQIESLERTARIPDSCRPGVDFEGHPIIIEKHLGVCACGFNGLLIEGKCTVCR